MIRVKLVFSLPNTGMWDFIIVSPKDVDQWLRRWIDYGYVLSGYHYVVTGDVPGRDVLERI
jgi:hypothetical protein